MNSEERKISMDQGLVEESEEQRRRGGWRRGSVLTERDVALVTWIGRQRFATCEQVQMRFSMTQSKAYERLRGRCLNGLLVRRRVLHGDPGVYMATRRGLRLAELDLPLATATAQSFTHDLRVTETVARLEITGRTVVTEREFQARERRRIGIFSIDIPSHSASGRSSTHRPDCIIEASDGAWAVEVELTAKSPARLREILRGYRRAHHLAGVLYVVPTERAAQRLRDAAQDVHMGERFRVSTIGAH